MMDCQHVAARDTVRHVRAFLVRHLLDQCRGHGYFLMFACRTHTLCQESLVMTGHMHITTGALQIVYESAVKCLPLCYWQHWR